jgi:hypothetical protein
VLPLVWKGHGTYLAARRHLKPKGKLGIELNPCSYDQRSVLFLGANIFTLFNFIK